MLSGFELRFAKALRDKLEEEMASYIPNLSNINMTSRNAIILVAKEQERYDTYQDVLDLMSELEKHLTE